MAKIVTGAVLIGGAIALDVVTAGAATPIEVAAITSLGSMGATLMLSGIAQWLHLGDTGQQGVSGRKGFRPWQIIYGRQRVTGAVIDESLSDGGNGDNRWLWVVEAIAAHVILAIDATYLNQQQAFCNRNVNNGFNSLAGNLIGTDSTNGGDMSVNGMVQPIHPTDLNFREYSNFYWDGNPRFWMAQYDGSQTAADPFYMALCATNSTTNTPHWDSTCVGRGIAYSLNRFWSNSNWSAGKPVVQYDVRGKRDIYDPRSGTSGYTENATLVLADYMMNQKWGMLFDIGDFDPDTLIAAANICDEVVTLSFSQIVNTVTYTSEPRYYINATISTSMGGGQVMQTMLEAMGGRISYIGGTWYIFPGVWQGISGVSIGEGNFLSGLEWKPTRKSRDIFNEVRGQFMCANGWNTVTAYAQGFDVYNVTAQTVENNFNGQWQMTDMPPFAFNTLRDYASDPYLTEDGGVKYLKNVSFPYTISVAYAQRLSKILLLRNRWQGTGSVKLPIQFLGIQPNDVIEINYARFGWSAKTVEVLATHIDLGSVDAQGNFTPPSITIDFAECDPSIYTWLSTDELPLTGGQAMAGPTTGDPIAPTNLTLTSGIQTTTTPTGTYYGQPLIEANWTASADASVVNGGHYLLYVQVSGATTWGNAIYVPGTSTQALIGQVSSGVTYNVGIVAVRYDGSQSAMVTNAVTVGDGSISVGSGDVILPAVQGIAQSFASSISKNLVPDSEMQLWGAYWNNVGAGWNTLPGVGFGGMNGKVAPATLSGISAQANSSQFAMVVGETYTLSGAINATTVTAGAPCWAVIAPGGATVYATCAQTPGTNGRVSTTFTFSPSGYTTGQVVPVEVWANTAACTFTGTLIFSAPMVAPSSGLTPYVGNFADDLTGLLPMGALPSGLQELLPVPGVLAGSTTVSGGTGNALSTIDTLSSFAAQCGQNMIENGNFERGMASWTVVHGTSSIDTSESYMGTQALKSLGGATQTSSPVSFAPGHTYLLQVWVMTNGSVVGNGSYGAGADFIDPSNYVKVLATNGTAVNFAGTYPGVLLAVSAATPWTLLQMAFTVETACSLTLSLTDDYGTGNANAAAWFDQVTLQDITANSATLSGVPGASLVNPSASGSGLDLVLDGSTYKRVAGVNSSNQITASSVSNGAISSNASSTLASPSTLTGSNAQILSCAQTCSQGTLLIFVSGILDTIVGSIYFTVELDGHVIYSYAFEASGSSSGNVPFTFVVPPVSANVGNNTISLWGYSTTTDLGIQSASILSINLMG